MFIEKYRLGEKVLELYRGKEEVISIRPSPDKIHLAVGYSDGVVKLFNLAASLNTESPEFAVHRSAVNILRFDSEGLYSVCSVLLENLMMCPCFQVSNWGLVVKIQISL